jgi:exodeoxyribonuclease V gamma subunit
MQKRREIQFSLFRDDYSSFPLKVVFSNDMHSLSQRLAEEFFSPETHPFEKRLIIVPHISLKEFLVHCFVDHPRLKIAAGVKILPLNQAVMEIAQPCFASANQNPLRKRVPSLLELSLAIEEKLYHFLAEKKEDQILMRYLDARDEEKKQKRITSLSEQLAQLYARYGLYGISFLPKWLMEKDQGWQQALWHEIFSDQSLWTYPLSALKEIPVGQLSGKIALFGFSYLAPVHLSFFSSCKATLYQLSPSALFWEDTASDKERLFTRRALKRKGAKEAVCEEIDRYMQQSHPFLGNWGKLRRECLKSLDSFELIEEEVYREPQERTLLADLKRSMLTLDAVTTLTLDDSIQTHSATSRLREVEVLRDALETLLQAQAQKGDPITPREILIASPDIALYAPYIQILFAQSALPFAIQGIPISKTSLTVRGFLQLLKLKEARFALPEVIKVLQCLPFMEKNGFVLDEIHQLCKWFRQAEIREKLSGDSNSWEAGIDRLLHGLTLIPTEKTNFECWPIACIPQSEIDLFNRFLELFENMKNDLGLLAGKKSASEWLDFFLQMADKYFHLEWEKESFFQQLRALSLSCRSLKSQVWSFESIERVLVHIAQTPSGEISSPQLQKVTFTSLRQGNIRPARILWCLGMDEGVFPRSDSSRSLCEMSRFKAMDYCPHPTDEDRALFLDLFLQARDYLIFSYQRLNPDDGKPQGASILIEELNQYLCRDDIKSGIFHFDHPTLPFDRIYFSRDGKIKKWSETDFLAAKAHYFPHCDPNPLLSLKSLSPASDVDNEIIIDIRQLKKLARHPLQFYFNEGLKIYLKEEEDEEEKEFFISFLRKSVLRKKALKTTVSQTMRQLRAEGKLPSGLFQDIAWQDLEEEVADLLHHLNDFGVHPEEIHSIRFCARCREHEKNEAIFPPLSLPLSSSKRLFSNSDPQNEKRFSSRFHCGDRGQYQDNDMAETAAVKDAEKISQLEDLSLRTVSKNVYIVGKLDDITPKGLLVYGESDLKSLIKAWPLYLIYLCSKPENPKLLFTKSGEEIELAIPDINTALSAYLEYFLIAKTSPSPLMPDWASALLQKSETEFSKAISKASDEDPYLNFLKRRQGLFDPKETFALWSAPLRQIFAPLLQREGNDDF